LPIQAATRRRGLFLVLAATFLWSLAGVFVRLIPHLDFGTVLFFRGLFGGVCGLGIAFVEWRLGGLQARRLLSPLAPLVVCLAAFAISAYVAALMTTTVADVLVIYATLPFLAAGMAFIFIRERASRRTLIAAGLAMIGIVVMAAGGLGHGHIFGQSLALAMTVTFALLVVLQRRDPTLPVAPLNALAALVASGFGYSVSTHTPVSAFDLGVLFVFGATTIAMAFALFMEGAKHVPPAEAALVSMLDIGMGPLWVLLAFGEIPDLTTLIGGGFVIAAALWRLAPELRRPSRTVAPAAAPL
jgi:drug/metabolite transporter (DMT)-like permease